MFLIYDVFFFLMQEEIGCSSSAQESNFSPPLKRPSRDELAFKSTAEINSLVRLEGERVLERRRWFVSFIVGFSHLCDEKRSLSRWFSIFFFGKITTVHFLNSNSTCYSEEVASCLSYKFSFKHLYLIYWCHISLIFFCLCNWFGFACLLDLKFYILVISFWLY